MPAKGDIAVTRARPREELLFGLWHDGEDSEAGLEGYDSSQRAEILVTLEEAPGDGMIQTALLPDIDDDWG